MLSWHFLSFLLQADHVFKVFLTKVISYHLSCPFPDTFKVMWAKSSTTYETWAYWILLRDYRRLYFLLVWFRKSYCSFWPSLLNRALSRHRQGHDTSAIALGLFWGAGYLIQILTAHIQWIKKKITVPGFSLSPLYFLLSLHVRLSAGVHRYLATPCLHPYRYPPKDALLCLYTYTQEQVTALHPYPHVDTCAQNGFSLHFLWQLPS